MESKQTPETVTWTDKFLKVAQHLPPADAFAIAAFIDELVEEEKRKEAIAFLNSVTEDGCNNYFRKGDEWFLGDPEEEEDAEGPFTGDQLYDQYLLFLTQNKEL